MTAHDVHTRRRWRYAVPVRSTGLCCVAAYHAAGYGTWYTSHHFSKFENIGQQMTRGRPVICYRMVSLLKHVLCDDACEIDRIKNGK